LGGWRSRRRASEDSVNSMSSLGSAPAMHQSPTPPLPPLQPRMESRLVQTVELSDSSRDLLDVPKQQGYVNESRRSRLTAHFSSKTSSVGVDDMDLSVENVSPNLQAPCNGNGGENGDRELVAAVGGTAYLKASKKVWAMRIIVIATFVGECTLEGGSNLGGGGLGVLVHWFANLLLTPTPFVHPSIISQWCPLLSRC
jgi:hypothetical protein